MIEIEPAAGPARAYLASPEGKDGPGVLVLHAWWGLTPFVMSVCDRLATEGFVSLAPDLYDGGTAETVEEAKRLANALDEDRADRIVAAAVERLRSVAGSDWIGIIGFSLGGFWALKLGDHVRAAVTFYGGGDPEHARAEVAYQGHFGESDDFEPLESVRELEDGLRAKAREVQINIYEGVGHWFFESDRPGHYDAEAARLAWVRTVEFLHRHLG